MESNKLIEMLLSLIDFELKMEKKEKLKMQCK